MNLSDGQSNVHKLSVKKIHWSSRYTPKCLKPLPTVEHQVASQESETAEKLLSTEADGKDHAGSELGKVFAKI